MQARHGLHLLLVVEPARYGCPGPRIERHKTSFLGNIQRDGTFSVIPRVSGGHITPKKLVAIRLLGNTICTRRLRVGIELICSEQRREISQRSGRNGLRVECNLGMLMETV